MSFSDFRQITIKGEASRAERLFRAAVSAFCCLTRPSRREIAQLEDLTLPLFDCVSVESRRYVAAALSECRDAPGALVRRLCDETVDIAAPLLIRSNALSDIDLIALIGRHGYAHARAIARRPGLNPAIARLVAALDRKALAQQPERQSRDVQEPPPVAEEPRLDAEPAELVPGEAAENARRRLRSMMRPAGMEPGATLNPFADRSAHARLRDTALTGNPAFFHTALADALEIDFAAARRIAGTSSYTWLLAPLRALDLTEDQAFLITAAVCPSQFAHPEAIRLFLSRYRLLHSDAALERVRALKAEAIAAAVDRASPTGSTERRTGTGSK